MSHSDLAHKVDTAHVTDRLEQLTHRLTLVNRQINKDGALPSRLMGHKLVSFFDEGDRGTPMQRRVFIDQELIALPVTIVQVLLQHDIDLLSEDGAQLRGYLVDYHW